MRRGIALGLALSLWLIALVGTASAVQVPTKCPSSAKKTAASNAHVDVVRFGTVDSYKVDLTQTASGVAVWSPGDVDMAICEPGQQAVCTSTMPAGFVDSCPAVGAGTFIVLISHCMDEDCGYPPTAKADLPYVFMWGP